MKKILITLMCVVMVVAMMPVMAFAATTVADADALVEALEKGEDVTFAGNIKIDPAKMSSGYGTTGINIKTGQTIDGAGYTLDIRGAGGTWDSGINTTGGLIKNLTVTGSFRGIFVNHNSTHSEKVVLDNVTVDGTTYTISVDQAVEQGLEAKNSTFNGWTSYAATLGEAYFEKCNFGEGNGYAFCRPYAETTFNECTFEEGYLMEPRANVVLINCYLGETLITEENVEDLIYANVEKVTVKNPEAPKVEVEAPTVDATKPVEKVEVGVSTETKKELENVSNEVIESVTKDAETKVVVEENVVEAIEEAVVAGEEVEVSTTVVATPVEEKDVEATFGKDNVVLVETAAGDDTVAQYLDLSVLMTVSVNGQEVATGEVKELAKEVTFTIAVPKELKEVKDGYTREYYVIRVHDGKTDKLPVTVNADGTLSFKTDRFSTYALAYEDTAKAAPETPKTGDAGMMPWLAVMAVAAVGAVSFKKREN